MNDTFDKLRIDLYIHPDTNTAAKLDQILAALTVLQKGETKIMGELDALTTQVSENTTVEGSAVQLLTNLAAQITALKNDPVALAALASRLKGSSDALAAAITANTPAA